MIEDLRRQRASGSRLVEHVIAPKPTAKERVKHKAAISPAAYKDLTHKTPEAALFARLKKTASKKGSSPVTHDISLNLGTMTVAKMAAAARKAELEAELKKKVAEKHKNKINAMGGSLARNNPWARPFR